MDGLMEGSQHVKQLWKKEAPFLAFTVAPFGTWYQILAARIEPLHVKLSRAIVCTHAVQVRCYEVNCCCSSHLLD